MLLLLSSLYAFLLSFFFHFFPFLRCTLLIPYCNKVECELDWFGLSEVSIRRRYTSTCAYNCPLWMQLLFFFFLQFFLGGTGCSYVIVFFKTYASTQFGERFFFFFFFFSFFFCNGSQDAWLALVSPKMCCGKKKQPPLGCPKFVYYTKHGCAWYIKREVREREKDRLKWHHHSTSVFFWP